jgi:hypothetical protein
MNSSVQPSLFANEATPLLHNIGGPPSATLTWRGLKASAAGDAQSRIEEARKCGTWVRVMHRLYSRHPLFKNNWNSSVTVLKLFEPNHRKQEPGAARALVRHIDDTAAQLDWPRYVIADEKPRDLDDVLLLDDAMLTFTVIAKSTGSVWMRDRAPRLAPLHSPLICLGSGGTGYGRRVEWSSYLWFPTGVPSSLLERIAEANKKETST